MADVLNPGLLRWPTDLLTAQAATAYPLPIRVNNPAAQFGEDGKGCGFNPQSWNHRVVQPAVWPPLPMKCTPDQIITQFQRRHYTQGLAMVACWGLMWRKPDAIWGSRRLDAIERTLSDCAHCIWESKSLEEPWKMLTGSEHGQLGWTAVITSKTLHFLCRSMGCEQNPPAAIDGQVVRGIVWPTFRNSIPLAERPDNWESNRFDAYSRYMTAILVWADQRKWTTKEMENTIFAEFKSK
jgi:hypothetical protein